MYHTPQPGTAHVRDLLFIHSFAHEHHIARPVLASVWRRLAGEGTGVLSIDLPGCGDSAGDFSDATWPCWLSSVITAHRWLTGNSDRPAYLGGLRLGATLALEAARQLETAALLLLQPILRGDQMLTQFLRVRVAFSGLRDDVGERETTAKLRARIADGQNLEVGGFLLSTELAQSIDKIDLGAQPAPLCHLHWIETGLGIPPLVAAAAECWQAAGARISLTHVDVKPYWVHTRGLVAEYGSLADAVAFALRDSA